MADAGYDLVIRNARIVDPGGHDAIGDVAVRDGLIVSMGETVSQKDLDAATEVFDATGLVCTPGLVDMHAHVYEHATPLGINPDKFCLGRGVTTVVDAGSAGASTLAGLKHFIAEPSTTRVLALINISLHGLAAAGCSGQGLGGELDALTHVSTAAAVDAAAANPDWVVGFKLRLSADCANDGKNEAEAYARALAAAGAAKLPLMVHHTFSSVPLNGAGGCPSALRAGDIYTHTLHGFPSTLIEKDPASEGGCVRYQFTAAAKEARARGVLFDVGHGAGSFSWTAAEVGAAEGFLPDIISTDLHLDCCEGPAYDLPTVMTKFLHVGMPLLDVIRAVTSTPAAAIGWADRVGSLAPGRAADISVFKLDKPEGGVQIEDCQSQLRTVSEVLKCVAVWKDGTKCTVTQADSFPLNQETLKRGAQAWSRLLVRDPKQWSNLAC